MKVRVTKLKSQDTALDSDVTETENEQTKELERSVKEGLEKAGIDTGGIITYALSHHNHYRDDDC